MQKFVGRVEMLQRLESLWQKHTSSLVTCRGRRRIGKSTLIEEFATRTANHFISIDGQAPGDGINNAVQLRSFMQQLSAVSSVPEVRVDNWLQAFQLLDSAIPKSGRTVLLLDEISWMGGYDRTFVGTLKIAWDKFLKKHEDLILVLCGSESSWIAKNLLKSTGFAGRDSLDLVLDELSLRDCLSFWESSGNRISLGEKLDFLSVTGGVPKYLEELDESLTAQENIRRLCFTPEGLLYRDFEQIFSRMYGTRYEERKRIVEAVKYGAKSPAEIASSMGIERNGHLVEHLDDLTLAGFLAKDENFNPVTGRSSRIARYRLRDNYLRFYLHHIEPVAREIRQGNFKFSSLSELKGWDAIKGLQFENLVAANYRVLLPILGIDGANLKSVAPFRRDSGDGTRGVQIDLLIQTENCVYVIEVKRREHIGVEVADEVGEKVRKLALPTGISVRTALVYDGEIASTLRTERKFDFLIPVSRLFGL